MENQDERGRKRWRKLVTRFVNWILRQDRPSGTIAEPRPVDSPRGKAILLRGIGWWNDPTFEELETRLPNESIGVVRFSYKGPQSPKYEPFHTITDMGILIDYLDQYVGDTPGDIPPDLFLGHSFGGLVIANWICRADPPADHQEVLEKIHKVFLFATPLFSPYPKIRIYHPRLKKEVDYYFAPYDFRPLLELFPRVIVLWANQDPIAPYNMASLQSRDPQREPLDEVEIPSGHQDICNHCKAVETVMHWISQD